MCSVASGEPILKLNLKPLNLLTGLIQVLNPKKQVLELPPTVALKANNKPPAAKNKRASSCNRLLKSSTETVPFLFQKPGKLSTTTALLGCTLGHSRPCSRTEKETQPRSHQTCDSIGSQQAPLVPMRLGQRCNHVSFRLARTMVLLGAKYRRAPSFSRTTEVFLKKSPNQAGMDPAETLD